MRRALLLIVLLLASTSLGVEGQGAATPVTIDTHAIDPNAYTDPRQFAFLTTTLKDVEVVSLGESIHFTHEFPLVRVGIAKHLNEQLGFRVVALEGSPADLWVAQDQFLGSLGSEADARDAQRGVFAIWATPEMRELFLYEARSWATPTPFYMTAYDVQPGTGQGVHGAEVFRLLAERLTAYAPAPDGLDRAAWIDTLARLTGGCNDYRASDHDAIATAIDQLAGWTTRAAPAVSARFPAVPHGDVLRLLPESLRASLGLCTDLAAGPKRGYKATRDTHAAEYTLRLKSAMPGGKLILWAHFSHVFYNADHWATSVGEKLHAALGPRLYTIMPLAEGGGTILIYDDNNDDIGYGRVHGEKGPLGERFSRLSTSDVFIDLRQPAIAGDPFFASPQPIWFESEPASVLLAKDVDAVVWIKRVSTPGLPLGQRLLFSSMHYTTEIGITCGVGVVGLTALLVYRRAKRRKRQA